MMPTMSAASRPSRRVMKNAAVTKAVVLRGAVDGPGDQQGGMTSAIQGP